VPFTVVHSTGPTRVRVHGNAGHGLGALGGSTVLEWQGRGAVHGESRSGVAQGIDPGSRRGAGGKVTAWETVHAMLPMLGVHGGHGDIHGRRRGIVSDLCSVGSSEVVGRDGACSLGVSRGWWCRSE
jgi:hypothetical protein